MSENGGLGECPRNIFEATPLKGWKTFFYENESLSSHNLLGGEVPPHLNRLHVILEKGGKFINITLYCCQVTEILHVGSETKASSQLPVFDSRFTKQATSLPRRRDLFT